MKKTVLFIQGAGKGAYHADEKLVTSLQHLLGSPYQVRYPVMQNEDNANYETWALQIKEELTALNNRSVILAGHSVGASILIKFLAENEISNAIAGIFLIATPFWGGDKGWTDKGFEALVLPTEADTKLPNNVPMFLYQSHDDDVVPFAHLALYAKRFPYAMVREFDGRGHQLSNDLSEAATDIRKLL